MPVLALLVAIQDAGGFAAAGRAHTSAIVRCTAPAGDPTVGEPGDVVVCGRRRADRFRVPLIVHDAGDRRYEGVPAERARLIHLTMPMDDRGPFLVGGGMAGLSTTVGASGRTVVEGVRPLAL